MKKQTTSALKIFFQKHISFLTILIASVMAICSVPKNNSSFKIFDAKWTSEITPDTVVEEITEDTLVYSDGADTIYLINDTLPYDDSLGLHFRDLEIADNFYVTFGGIDKNVNPGIYGFYNIYRHTFKILQIYWWIFTLPGAFFSCVLSRLGFCDIICLFF